MKYFLDTEFIECAKQRKLLGFNVGPAVPTIDLISIALVAEDGREFYALNAECELEYAWANEWVRDNVLYLIFREYYNGDALLHNKFSLSTMRWLFKQYGKTRRELVAAIGKFLGYYQYWVVGIADAWRLEKCDSTPAPEFFGDYAGYDWVVFCQLFGRMNDLPKGFPMYCRDLKQEQDRLGISSEYKKLLCPDPARAHSALEDARWAKQWHEVLEGQAAHVD